MSNVLKYQLCYLAGPMECVHDRGELWRNTITPTLNKMGIGVLNPLKKQFIYDEFSEDNDFVKRRQRLIEKKDYDGLSQLMKVHVVRPDLAMIDAAHFIITYINKDVHMCGSYWEICTAFNQRKPILIMCEQGKINVPYWLWGLLPHEYFFDSWDALIEYIHRINEEFIIPSKFWRFIDLEKIYIEIQKQTQREIINVEINK